MRKIAVLLCVVAALISSSACQKIYTHDVYQLIITANEVFNDSVGDDWQIDYVCDGNTITSGEQWIVPRDVLKTITIDVTIIEKDKWSDVGSGSLPIVLKEGFETSTNITVIEENGKNSGNKAQWEIFCRVEHVKKASVKTDAFIVTRNCITCKKPIGTFSALRGLRLFHRCFYWFFSFMALSICRFASLAAISARLS